MIAVINDGCRHAYQVKQKQNDALFLVDVVASMLILITHDNSPNPTMPDYSARDCRRKCPHHKTPNLPANKGP